MPRTGGGAGNDESSGEQQFRIRFVADKFETVVLQSAILHQQEIEIPKTTTTTTTMAMVLEVVVLPLTPKAATTTTTMMMAVRLTTLNRLYSADFGMLVRGRRTPAVLDPSCWRRWAFVQARV